MPVAEASRVIVTRSVDSTLYFAGTKFSTTGTSVFLPSGDTAIVPTANVFPVAREPVIWTR